MSWEKLWLGYVSIILVVFTRLKKFSCFTLSFKFKDLLSEILNDHCMFLPEKLNI